LVLYDDDMIQEISDNVDLLEYVENSIDLKKKGRDYFGKCPLHIDNTPSFSITPDKNSFYCFSCGRGGGIIQYLSEYENMNFDAALEKASRLANVDLKSMCQSLTVKYNKKLKRQLIESTVEIPEEHKILDKKIYDQYRIGSVDEWLKEGIRQEEIDLFEIRLDDRSNRIVYPVYDMDGNFINVKGRTRFSGYKKMGICKYINYYPVGTVDYFQGINITEQYIHKTKELKIFESLKSTMKLFGHGIKDSASAEKHDLTPEQIAWIIRSDIKSVVLCYDSDITYKEKTVQKNINMLKRFVNLYIIQDKDNLLGGKEAKNSPIDKGFDIWSTLYSQRKKVT
jgi:DNA primase